MIYKLTLLKDLPEYPAGTIFKSSFEPTTTVFNDPVYDVRVPVRNEPGYWRIERWPISGIISDPSWFKKEIDPDSLVDLKCPICGGTQGNYFSTDYYRRDMESFDYGVQFSVGFECLCGHKRILYGTRHGNEKLREMLEKEVTT